MDHGEDKKDALGSLGKSREARTKWCMRRTSGSLLRPGCRTEVGEGQSGDADKFQPVGPLDLAKELGFDPGSSH